MTKKIIIALIFFISVFTSQAQKTIIKAGHMFDARSGKMLDNQILIIKNGIIEEVGSNLKFSNADTVIDLSDSWVLPGLMDCHVHITENIPYRNYSAAQSYTTEGSSLRAIWGSLIAREFLENGFTTIRELGNDANYVTSDVVKAIKKGWILGPTIHYAGKIIAPYGGQMRGVNIEHEHFWEFEYLDADTRMKSKKPFGKTFILVLIR